MFTSNIDMGVIGSDLWKPKPEEHPFNTTERKCINRIGLKGLAISWLPNNKYYEVVWKCGLGD